MYKLVLMFGRRENMYIPCNVFGISNVDNRRMVPYCTSFLYAKHVSSYTWFHSVGVQKLLLPLHVLTIFSFTNVRTNKVSSFARLFPFRPLYNFGELGMQ